MNILSGIRQLFKSPFAHRVAHDLYVAIVDQARQPVFYEDFDVQDTPEGRYDLVAVHAYLVLRRLRDEHERTSELAQALFDLMFADLDQNLREMGYGDTGVAKRIKKMAEGFYGRIKVYDEGLNDPNTDKLESALDRNLYRNCEPSKQAITSMVHYIRRQSDELANQRIEALMDGQVSFSPPMISGSQNGS